MAPHGVYCGHSYLCPEWRFRAARSVKRSRRTARTTSRCRWVVAYPSAASAGCARLACSFGVTATRCDCALGTTSRFFRCRSIGRPHRVRHARSGTGGRVAHCGSLRRSRKGCRKGPLGAQFGVGCGHVRNPRCGTCRSHNVGMGVCRVWLCLPRARRSRHCLSRSIRTDRALGCL